MSILLQRRVRWKCCWWDWREGSVCKELAVQACAPGFWPPARTQKAWLGSNYPSTGKADVGGCLRLAGQLMGEVQFQWDCFKKKEFEGAGEKVVKILWFLFQRIQVWFLAPTWCFTTVCNSSFRASDFLFWPPWTPWVQTHMQATHHTHTIQKNKVENEEEILCQLLIY